MTDLRGLEIRVERGVPFGGGIPMRPAPYIHYYNPDRSADWVICTKGKPPEEYIGMIYSTTTVKTKVTCPECNEWLHA